MKDRKKTDTYPITATLRSNGVAVNLVGYTVTINIVDKGTRAVKVANASCTITDAANGRVSYQPNAAAVDTSGAYDVEFKGVAGDGTVYHFPSSSYEPLYIRDNLG
jgi:hypothetical protein